MAKELSEVQKWVRLSQEQEQEIEELRRGCNAGADKIVALTQQLKDRDALLLQIVHFRNRLPADVESHPLWQEFIHPAPKESK